MAGPKELGGGRGADQRLAGRADPHVAPRTTPLSFDVLLARALAALPQRVALKRRDAGPDAFYVAGLSRVVDAAAHGFIGAPDELLMRSLLDALFERLHAEAAYRASAAPASLDQHEVQDTLERRLRDKAALGLAGWTRPADRTLIRRCFAANPPPA